MSSYNTATLIADLQKDVKYTIQEAERLQQLNENDLLSQPAPAKWSIAQVLEHLNGYNSFYLPVMKMSINKSKSRHAGTFKPGWIGDYFTKLMQPKQDGTLAKKMSAPKEYNYEPDLDCERVLQEFIDGQQLLLMLLDEAKRVDIGKSRIPISISRMIKLKLGDGFRFLIAHQLRHFLQINNVKKQLVVTL